MDRMPGQEVVDRVRPTAAGVEGVRAIEKLAVRKSGMTYRVDDSRAGRRGDVAARRARARAARSRAPSAGAMPQVQNVLVHMEPYERDAAEMRT